MNTPADWIDRYARIGISDLPKSHRSARYAFNVLCLIGSVASFCYALLYFWVGLTAIAVPACFTTLIVFCPLVAVRSERLAAVMGVGICCVVFSTMTYFWGRDTLLHLFILLALLNALILMGTHKPKEAAVFAIVSATVSAASHLAFKTPALGDAIDPRFVELLATANIFALAMMTIWALLALSHQIRSAQRALAAEHARSEALLQNLLPEDIATRLKDKPGEVIADGLPAVTLLFADIVDFTPRSLNMSPNDLVAFLNRIFSRFDALTADRGLEKIKTIGDAYMVAAGLPAQRPDHAEVIADMALAMQAEVTRLSSEMGEEVKLRIGIHSGPAVAGVIGTSKVFYDVWGDTVNTASRMESHGDPGRIQVTAATRELLKDAYIFDCRGLVDIKGIDRIRTYWLTGRA